MLHYKAANLATILFDDTIFTLLMLAEHMDSHLKMKQPNKDKAVGKFINRWNEIIYMQNNLRNRGKKPPIIYAYLYYMKILCPNSPNSLLSVISKYLERPSSNS